MSIYLNKRKQILLFSKDALNSIDHTYLYFSELFKCVTNTSSLTSKEIKCMKMLRNSLVDRWKSCDDKPPAQTCSTRRECENHEYRRSREQRNQMCADRVVPGCSVTSTLAIFTPKSSPHSANSLHTDWSCWQAGHHGAKLQQTCKPFNPITQAQPEETQRHICSHWII